MESEFIKYGGYIGMIMVGALMYFFPARRKELDDATAKLIRTLQETVGALERDLNIYKEKTLKLESQQHENMAKLSALEAEKQILKDFIAGRDKKTDEFQNEALRLHRKNAEEIKNNSDRIGELLKILNQHFINKK